MTTDRYLNSKTARVTHLVGGWRGEAFPGYYARCGIGSWEHFATSPLKRICAACVLAKNKEAKERAAITEQE